MRINLYALIVTSYFFLECTHGCVLYSIAPTFCIPNFCSMLYSAFCGGWCSYGSHQQLKWDRISESWTYNCPSTSHCKYGVSSKDYDECSYCLEGPDGVCHRCEGDCGDGLICQFGGPLSCQGKCVSRDEFENRKLGDKCGIWDGDCGKGLKCRFDDRSALLVPFYSTFMHFSGECVTDVTFNSRKEGDYCGDLVGYCEENSKCTGSVFPWCPRTCELDPDIQVGNKTDINGVLVEASPIDTELIGESIEVDRPVDAEQGIDTGGNGGDFTANEGILPVDGESPTFIEEHIMDDEGIIGDMEIIFLGDGMDPDLFSDDEEDGVTVLDITTDSVFSQGESPGYIDIEFDLRSFGDDGEFTLEKSADNTVSTLSELNIGNLVTIEMDGDTL